MCLAVSGEIMEIDGINALVNIKGIEMKVNISLIDEGKKGDYILIHGGFGIQKIDRDYHDFLQNTIDSIYYEFGGNISE